MMSAESGLMSRQRPSVITGKKLRGGPRTTPLVSRLAAEMQVALSFKILQQEDGDGLAMEPSRHLVGVKILLDRV